MRAPIRLVVLAGLLLTAQPSSTWADCSSDCVASYHNCLRSSSPGADWCLSSQGVCLSRCTMQRGQHGAIAYSSRTAVYGFSFDFDTAGAAGQAAVRNCRAQERGADDCRVVVTFHDACGALARDGRGAYGSAWGVSRREASAKALNECRPHGGNGCKIEREVCSGTAR